jgi:OmcA/MtrC family decaheme c-type cytochrome
MCHQPQTVDPNTGNTLDMKVFIHKLHDGSSLPSVVAGTPYQIYGHGGYSDFSKIVYPANIERCETCHNPKNGAAQTNAWLTTPGSAQCGSCHDNVNFASGVNHAGGPQLDDSQCAQCHIPQGELPFDASIMGAHTIADQAPGINGLNFTLVKVTNGGAGQKPVVTFTVTDNNGNGIPMSNFTTGSNSLSLTMAGPTSDYGYTSFGSDVTTPGYVTESVATTATCTSGGSCQYTFTHAVPAKATGTYTIGIEGRLSATILPNTTQAVTTNYGGVNQVINFSVDGTPVTPRRTIVAMANCNACHSKLEVHGDLRNNVTYCVLCHNPSNTDSSTRPSATVVAQRSLPPQGINFAMMVHKIHSGINIPTFGQTYTIVGYGGSINDFTTTMYPAMGPTGAVQDTAECYMCHTGGSESVLPIGKNAVTDPQGLLNPAPATTSACTACHLNQSAFAHAQANTDPKFGESCDVCHGASGAYSATAVHAGQ